MSKRRPKVGDLIYDDYGNVVGILMGNGVVEEDIMLPWKPPKPPKPEEPKYKYKPHPYLNEILWFGAFMFLLGLCGGVVLTVLLI